MQNARRTVLACLIFAAVPPCFAATNAATKAGTQSSDTWQREPVSFVGIAFDRPLTSQIPKCPTIPGSSVADTAQASKLATPCYAGEFASIPTIHNTPDLGFYYETTAMLDKGIPTAFIVKTDAENYGKLLTAFTQRYGRPHGLENGTVQNGIGASFDNQIARWAGKRISIKLEKRSQKITTTEATISDTAYWAEQASKSRAREAAGAEKL